VRWGCRYVGELIVDNEADKRGRDYDKRGVSYLYNLDGFATRDDEHCPSECNSIVP
jgi:hypothetical protein